MSATFFNSAHPGRVPPTQDLESTTDLQGGTTDLAPATLDIEPAEIVGAPNLERVEPRQPAQPTAPAPGAVLCDRFIVERVVGTGGTAVVYQARDMSASGND